MRPVGSGSTWKATLEGAYSWNRSLDGSNLPRRQAECKGHWVSHFEVERPEHAGRQVSADGKDWYRRLKSRIRICGFQAVGLVLTSRSGWS